MNAGANSVVEKDKTPHFSLALSFSLFIPKIKEV
jgi:hypothetical protein